MKRKLNARSVESLKAKPGAAQTDYFDADVDSRGLALRVSASGARAWYLFYRMGRRLRRYKIGVFPDLQLADARAQAQKLRYQINHEHKDPAEARQIDRAAMTVEDLARIFITKYSKPKKKSWKEDKRICDQYIVATMGKQLAKDVERFHIRRMLEEIAERAPVMANRVKSCTSKMFKWASREEYIGSNPCVEIAAPGGEEDSRDRTFTDEELARLWKASEAEDLGAILRLQLLTCARVGEVCKMEWAHVDLDKKALWIQPDSKNGKPHAVPLTNQAVRILKAIRKSREEHAKKHEREVSAWVFPARRGLDSGTLDIQKCIQRVRTAAAVEDCRSHDLRRSAASRISANGVSRIVLKKLLNHGESSDVTGKVYDMWEYLPERREALDQWAAQLDRIIRSMKVVPKKKAAARV